MKRKRYKSKFEEALRKTEYAGWGGISKLIKALGTNRGTVGEWRKGNIWSIEDLNKVCKLFNCDSKDLIEKKHKYLLKGK